MERVDGSWFVPPENAHEAEVTPAPTPARAPVDADPAPLLEESGWSVSEAEACLATAELAPSPEPAPAAGPVPVPLPAPETVVPLRSSGAAEIEWGEASGPSAQTRLADLEAAIGAALVTPAVEPVADTVAEAFFAEGDDPVPAPGLDWAPADEVDEPLDPAVGAALDAAFGDAELDPLAEAPAAALAEAPAPDAEDDVEDDAEPAWADALDDDAPTGPAFETPAGLAAARAADPAPARTRRAAPGTPVAHPVVRARVASVARRGLAWAVDGAVLVSVVTGTVYAAAHLAGHPAGLGAVAHDPLLLGAALGFGAILGLVYVGLFTAAGGQTFGARLAGIRILDQRGASPSVGRAFARAAAAALGTLACLLGLVWVLLDDRGQALHDWVARTYVVEA